MQKIKTVFKIDRETGLAIPEVMPDSTWYLQDDARATEKHDGRAAAVIEGKLYVRYDRKIQDKYRHLVGKVEITEDMLKDKPLEGIACEELHDPKTGHHPFWVPPTEQWILDAFEQYKKEVELPDGTYELVGPKVRCNVYGLKQHEFWRHGKTVVDLKDRSFEGLKQFLKENPRLEGIVFQKVENNICLFAKVRQKDFGFEWNSAAEGVRAKRKR